MKFFSPNANQIFSFEQARQRAPLAQPAVANSTFFLLNLLIKTLEKNGAAFRPAKGNDEKKVQFL